MNGQTSRVDVSRLVAEIEKNFNMSTSLEHSGALAVRSSLETAIEFIAVGS